MRAGRGPATVETLALTYRRVQAEYRAAPALERLAEVDRQVDRQVERLG
ncbi:hypothetical protein [Pseudonocardia sp. EC080625-04]|nr:hypothetical protein [Pseudonocardia sp. EC080625-04]